MSITLYAILAEQSAAERQSLLAAKTRGDSGQLSPPLVIASKNGHDKVVHTLLSQFKPDLTQTGSVKFGNFLIEDASALWVAAGSGHLKIVKMLVKAGADVNQA